MPCEHRYAVDQVEGKGVIKCKRCGDINRDGLHVGQTEDQLNEILERIKWERAKARGLQLPEWKPSESFR